MTALRFSACGMLLTLAFVAWTSTAQARACRHDHSGICRHAAKLYLAHALRPLPAPLPPQPANVPFRDYYPPMPASVFDAPPEFLDALP